MGVTKIVVLFTFLLIVIQLQIVRASNPNLLSNIMVEGIDHSQECIECGQLCDPIIPCCKSCLCDYIYPIGFQCVSNASKTKD